MKSNSQINVAREMAIADQARSSSTDEHLAGELLQKAIIGIIRNGHGDLTMRQMAILLLTREKKINITDLAKLLGISLSSVSRSANTLERKKFIRRKRVDRNVFINTTPKGEAIIGKSVMEVTKS